MASLVSVVVHETCAIETAVRARHASLSNLQKPTIDLAAFEIAI
jgi:hypothetical protein